MKSLTEKDADAAMEWLSGLPRPEQIVAADYYGHRFAAAAVFHHRFGFDRLQRWGGQLCPRVNLFDVPDNSRIEDAGLEKNVSNIRLTLNDRDLNFLLIPAVVPSARFEGSYHGVALKFDKTRKTIEHQDPQGDAIRSEIRAVLEDVFPELPIIDHGRKQEYDDLSCGMIIFFDCIAYAQGQAPDPNIHKKLPYLRAADAPVILAKLAQTIEAGLKQPQDALRKEWQQAGVAIKKRDPQLVPMDIPLSTALNFLIRLAGNRQAYGL